MKSTVFFTFVSDKYFYPVGTPIMINSFKRFHPDIDLVVYRQDMVDKIFKEKKLTFYNATPTFAKLLADKYERVIKIDADTVVTGPLSEILETDWQVGGAWNLNDLEDASVANVSKEDYVQGGLVGSSEIEFWDEWEKSNHEVLKYKFRENDILNLIWYNNHKVKKMKRLIWDREKNYLGCKSLNREKEFYVEGPKLMLRNEEVKAYHHARGGHLPKLKFEELGFPQKVIEFLNFAGHYGKSFKACKI